MTVRPWETPQCEFSNSNKFLTTLAQSERVNCHSDAMNSVRIGIHRFSRVPSTVRAGLCSSFSAPGSAANSRIAKLVSADSGT